ncbi:TadE/TadG family type IV pilus assembly protein [Cognatishimia maritima]|uniref:Flp pilus assembly protein TadG n=1 Tax=Cognatishimia maritima TaxID=870908 RepID=A0A1M5KBI0_9RHOB|nr:Tad domain-containing protein [Cognatishimia maritima]SHG50216.1 Flp pilus assembly protein TadG [Cognatishimia maritima]
MMAQAMCSEQKSGQDMRRTLRAFRRSEDGSMVFLSVFIFLIILLVGGIGVDMMSYHRDRAHLQMSLDNAVLAAADLSQPLDAESVVDDYLNSAGLGEYLTGTYVQEDPFEKTVSATIESNYVTQLMHLNGINSLDINVVSAAMERTPSTEISVVLDISGSMGVNNRLSLMQLASKRFISKSLERNVDPETGLVNDYHTSINVVPFAGQTNPGSTMFEELGGERFGTTTSENYFEVNEWGQDISNVVFWFDLDNDGFEDYSVKIDNFPDNDVDLFNKDDLDTYYLYALDYFAELFPDVLGDLSAPGETGGTSYFLGATIKGGIQPTTFFNEYGDPVDGPTEFRKTDEVVEFVDFYAQIVPNNESSCIEFQYNDFLTTGMPVGNGEQTPHFVNWDFDEVSQNWGWCPDDDMAIQYAQDDETKLHSFIDNIRLFDGTGTNYGMKYALATLDPASQPYFEYMNLKGEVPDAYKNRPLGWDADDSSKFIVLLTDGRTGAQVRPADELDTENNDTELDVRPAEDSVVESDQLENIELFLYQCELAKSQGVVVYTVALETSDVAAEEIRTCASSESHFFEVTGEELVDTFVSIASSIQRLRLIQ